VAPFQFKNYLLQCSLHWIHLNIAVAILTGQLIIITIVVAFLMAWIYRSHVKKDFTKEQKKEAKRGIGKKFIRYFKAALMR